MNYERAHIIFTPIELAMNHAQKQSRETTCVEDEREWELVVILLKDAERKLFETAKEEAES